MKSRWAETEDGLPASGLTVLCHGQPSYYDAADIFYLAHYNARGGTWTCDVTGSTVATPVCWQQIEAPPRRRQEVVDG